MKDVAKRVSNTYSLWGYHVFLARVVYYHFTTNGSVVPNHLKKKKPRGGEGAAQEKNAKSTRKIE